MKFAVFALVSNISAINIRGDGSPDVYGANGLNYSNISADYDTSQIGIDITKAGNGNNCREGDWTTVHWVGTLKDGREVTNSRAEPGGLPKTFALGVAEVFKCWDKAVPQLKKGSVATLHCPAYQVWGGAKVSAPLGGEPIPRNSDVDFTIEVLECNRTPNHNTLAETQP